MFDKLIFVGKKVSKAFLFAALLAEAVEFKDVSRDEEASFLGFLCVGFLHGTDVDAFRLAAFRTDEVVMVMTRLDDLVDVSPCAVDFVNDAERCDRRVIADMNVRFLREEVDVRCAGDAEFAAVALDRIDRSRCLDRRRYKRL